MKYKALIFLFLFITACCKDDFHTAASVHVFIFKDGKTLKEAGITPSFYYVANQSDEVTLPFDIENDSLFYLNSSYFQMMSFKPSNIIIRYQGLPISETDTLEILLDYDCDKSQKCSCKVVVLKYMKCNSVLLDDFTIRK